MRIDGAGVDRSFAEVDDRGMCRRLRRNRNDQIAVHDNIFPSRKDPIGKDLTGGIGDQLRLRSGFPGYLDISRHR